MKIKRRLNRVSGGTGSMAEGSCPEIFELESGEFVVIGTDVTEAFRGELDASGAGVLGSHEKAVQVPRIIVTSARTSIPEE